MSRGLQPQNLGHQTYVKAHLQEILALWSTEEEKREDGICQGNKNNKEMAVASFSKAGELKDGACWLESKDISQGKGNGFSKVEEKYKMMPSGASVPRGYLNEPLPLQQTP